MRNSASRSLGLACVTLALLPLLGCQPGVRNTNAPANINTAAANTNTNANTAPPANASASTVDAKEPEQYRATVKLSVDAVGDTATTAMPAVSANVARNGSDRVMEFTLPGGETVVFLEKADMHYLILPKRKQYAELNKESLGMDVRRMMTPAQIVSQAKGVPGMQLVGDENLNGRTVTKYRYEATANTQTKAGNVSTESFLIVDKETGLPVRSETTSQSTSGGNVQGYKGLRLVTEMTDIETTADAALFAVPTDFQKIEADQVKAQVDLIFKAISVFVGQVMSQARPQ